MISKLLIVDVNVSDEVKSLLEVLKEDSVLIAYYDYSEGFVVNNQNLLVDKLLALIRSHLETSTVNLQHLCFMNVEQMKTPMHSFKYNNQTHVISGIESKPEKLESWNFMGKLVADIAKTTEIRNIDFIDIDHLYFPKEHALIFDKIQEVTKDVEERAINYLKVAEDDKETIYNSENWLHTMFTTFYSDENKVLIDKYFKVNNSNIGFLNTKTMKLQDLQIYDSHVPNIDFESDAELNVSIIPLHGYENETDYNLMKDFIELLNGNTIVEFVYITDTMEDFTTRLTNTINKYCGENKDKINKVNVGFWLNPNISNPALMLTNHISANIDQELLEVVNQLMTNNSENVDQLKNHFIVKTSETFIDIFNMNVYDNMDVNTINFEIFNVSDTFNTNYNLLCQFLHNDYFISTLVNFNLTFLSSSDNSENLFELHNKIEEFDESGNVIDVSYDLFKDSQLMTDISNNEAYQGDMFITNISHINKSVQYNNNVNMAVYLKSDGPEIDKFMKKNLITNVILYDRELREHLADVRECLLPNTLLLTFDKQNTYQDIKDGLVEINNLTGVQISNVALFQDNKSMSKTYNLVNEESSIIKYPRFDDPSLNSWSKFQDFVTFLDSELGVKYFDLLMCKIYINPNWKYVIDSVSSNLTSLEIRSSQNNTGHTMFEGDWILESPLVDVNMIHLYFKESIKELEIQLGDMGENGEKYFNKITMERITSPSGSHQMNVKEIQVFIYGKNVALNANGGVATASSFLNNSDSFAAHRINDGHGSVYDNLMWHSSTSNVGEYITIELAQPYLVWDIEAVVVYHRENSHSGGVNRQQGCRLALFNDDELVSNVANFSDHSLRTYYRFDGYSIGNVSTFATNWSGNQIVRSNASDLTYIPYSGSSRTSPTAPEGYFYPKLTDSDANDISYVSQYTDNGKQYVSYAWSSNATINIDYDLRKADFMILAGGGAGQGGRWGGGGGGGGIVIGREIDIVAGEYNIVVGAGGTATSNQNTSSPGENSEAFGYVALGGGGGGNSENSDYADGGSGGGFGDALGFHSDTGTFVITGGSANYNNDSSNYPNVLVNGYPGGTVNTARAPGGGSGQAVGGNTHNSDGRSGNGSGHGAVGMKNNFYDGVDFRYGAGGGGGHGDINGNEGQGGGGGYGDSWNTGGGGDGGLVNHNQNFTSEGQDATPNTGSGGGGASTSGQNRSGGNGSNGMVILRFALDDNEHLPQVASDVADYSTKFYNYNTGEVLASTEEQVSETETKKINVFTESTTAYLNYDISVAEIKKYVAPVEPRPSYPFPLFSFDMGTDGNISFGGSVTEDTTITLDGTSHKPSQIEGPDGTQTGMLFTGNKRILATASNGKGIPVTTSWTIDCYINPGASIGSSNWKTLIGNYDTGKHWFIIRNDSDNVSIGYYDGVGSPSGFNDTGYNLPTNGWYRFTVSSDGNNTYYYLEGNDTPIAQNNSVIDTAAYMDMYAFGNRERGDQPWGYLYGFRLYGQSYLPSEIADPTDPIPTNDVPTNEEEISTDVSSQIVSLDAGIYNIVINKPEPPSPPVKYVVFQRISDNLSRESAIGEIECVLNNDTNVALATNGATAEIYEDFSITDNVASWSTVSTFMASWTNGNYWADKAINGTTTGNFLHINHGSLLVSTVITLQDAPALETIQYLYVNNRQNTDYLFRITEHRFVLLDEDKNVVATTDEITVGEVDITFNCSEFNLIGSSEPIDVSENIVVDLSTNTITSNVDFEIKYTPIDLSLSELTKDTTINPVRSQTVPFVKSNGNQEERSVTLHGDATYNRLKNEYYFPGDLSGYASIEGQLFGEHAMSMSFMYKSGGEQPVLETNDASMVRNTITYIGQPYPSPLNQNAHDTNDFAIYSSPNDQASIFYKEDDTSIKEVPTTTFDNSSNYTHIAITMNEDLTLNETNGFKLYVNGILTKSGNLSANNGALISGVTQPLQLLGKGPLAGSSQSSAFKGYLKNVRFYDHVLSQNQVSTIYTNMITNEYTDNKNFVSQVVPNLVISSSDISSGDHTELTSISMEITATPDSLLNITSSDINVTNGAISNFTNDTTNTWSFTFTPASSNIKSSVSISENSILNKTVENMTDKPSWFTTNNNHASNVFEFLRTNVEMDLIPPLQNQTIAMITSNGSHLEIPVTLGGHTTTTSEQSIASITTNNTIVNIPDATSLDSIDISQGYVQGTYQTTPGFTGVYKIPDEYKWIVYYTGGNQKMVLVEAVVEVNGTIGIRTIGQGNVLTDDYPVVNTDTYNAIPSDQNRTPAQYGLKNIVVKVTNTVFAVTYDASKNEYDISENGYLSIDEDVIRDGDLTISLMYAMRNGNQYGNDQLVNFSDTNSLNTSTDSTDIHIFRDGTTPGAWFYYGSPDDNGMAISEAGLEPSLVNTEVTQQEEFDTTDLQMEYIANTTATSSTWTSVYTNNAETATTSGTPVNGWTLGSDSDGDFYLTKNKRAIAPSYPNKNYLLNIDTTNSEYAKGITYELWVKYPSNLNFGNTTDNRGWLMGMETGWGPFLCVNDSRFGGIGMSPGATDNNTYNSAGLTNPGYITNFQGQLLHIIGYLYRSPVTSEGFRRGVWINGNHYPQETTQQSGWTDYPSLDSVTNSFNIGNHTDSNSGHHASNLNIYSFRHWHRQLTSDEIAKLYSWGPQGSVTSPPEVTTGGSTPKYTHMAITVKEGQVKRFYINGEVVDYVNKYRSNAIPVSRPIVGGKRQYQLFGYGHAANRGFSGLMKNIRIYNKALTAYEVRHLYAINSNFNDNDFSNTVVIPVPRPTLTFSALLPASKILDDGGNEYTHTIFTKNGIEFKAYNFTSTGTTSITLDNDVTEVEILIVGGGGGGGFFGGGGGGGGGVVYAVNQTLSAGTYDIEVGAGGVGWRMKGNSNQADVVPTSIGGDGNHGAQSGENSSIKQNGSAISLENNTISAVAVGGGGGGNVFKDWGGDGFTGAGRNGGSGGGSAGPNSNSQHNQTNTGGLTTQGNTIYDISSQTYISGGHEGNSLIGDPLQTTNIKTFMGMGGGGASSDIYNDGGNGYYHTNGKNGIEIDIGGSVRTVAAGGGGSQFGYHPTWHGPSPNYNTSLNYGLGGSNGVGGDGMLWITNANQSIQGFTYPAQYKRLASDGAANTGSGGGGSNGLWHPSTYITSGSGGSGIVIIQFPKAEVASGSSLDQSTLDLKLTASDDGLDGNITASDIITSNGTITAFSQISPTTWDLTYTSDYNKQENVGSLFIEQDSIYNNDVSDIMVSQIETQNFGNSSKTTILNSDYNIIGTPNFGWPVLGSYGVGETNAGGIAGGPIYANPAVGSEPHYVCIFDSTGGMIKYSYFNIANGVYSHKKRAWKDGFNDSTDYFQNYIDNLTTNQLTEIFAGTGLNTYDSTTNYVLAVIQSITSQTQPEPWWTREHNKASNRFEWTALNSAASDTSTTPTRPSITFSSPDLNHGESQNLGTISMTIYVSSNNLNVTQADLSFSNGVVSDFTKVVNNYYTFNFKSASVAQPSIIEILQDTVSNAETSNDFNEASNTFEWTWGFTISPPDVTITSSDVTHGGNFSGQQVNMILEFSSEVLHGNSVESTFSQFDVSATNGYVFDVSVLSQSQISFKLGSSSITESTSIFIPQNIISRTFNDIYTVNSNNTSNVFTWSYDSADLTITSLVVNDANGNTISAGDNINANELWLQFTFSESIYNFDKSYFNVTNCKITNISTDTTFTAFTIKTETYFPTPAIIELQSNKLITTGRGLQKYITGSTNLSFNWNYDNTRPKISMTSSQASGLTNNVSFVDLSFVSTMDTSDFTISSIQVTGHVTLSLTAISSTEYLVRVTPLSVTTINITVPENAYTEQQYGNGNENSVSFNWTYDNIPPTVDIFSPDIANGASSSDPYINIYFTISKPVDDFVLSDDANVANGTLGAMTKTNTFVNHTTSFNVTVASKTASHPYNGNGSSAGYFLNGVESPTIDFIVGQTYTFDQSDSTNSTHPLRFYTTAEKDQIYTSGVVYTDNAGTSGAITTITIDENTPSPLYYQCLNHGYMGFKGEVSKKESYTAKLYPTQNDTVSIFIFAGSITDSAGNTNATDSNEFDWIFDSNDLLTTLSSSDVTNNGTFANDSITLSLATTAAIVDFVEADISYENGTISNVDASAKTFTITSNSQGVPTTAFIIGGAVETSLGEPNIESNLFTWTYNPPIPKLVITSSQINEGDYTNISTIDFTLAFDQANVVFDQNSLTLSNCTISSFSGSGTTYQVSVNVPLDTDDAIRLTLPQGGAHVVDNGTHENDVSYDFEWYYDSIAPVITIGSSFVSEGELTNLKGLNLTVTSSEKINDLRLSDFGVSNAVVSNLSDTSGTSFTMSIEPLDDTTDCSINIFLKDNSVTDRAGNANGQSNTFAFSYEFFSSKEDSSAIEQLFDLDDDIPDEDKLSSSEIDLVISAAFTIPDTASPFAVAATENSNAGGNNTSDDNNTSTTRNPTFVKPPKITIPPEIKIRNRKVFTKLIDQIFATASESVKTLTIDKSSVAVTAAAEEQIAEVEEVVMVKSNQLEALDMSTLIEDPTKPSATYIPLANVNDFAIITIDGVTYTTRVESEGVFVLSSDDGGVIDNPDSLDGKWRSNDIYQATDINKIIFGSQIISTDPVAPEPPTLTITSGQVSNGGTTDISYIDLSFVFSTSVEISLNSIEPLNANTLIISRTIESIDSSNSYISVTVAPSPVIESSNNTIGVFVDVGAFYDTNNTFNDVQYTYSWNYSFVSDSGDSGDSNSSGIDIFGDIATQSSGLSQGLSDMGWEQSTYEVDPNNNVFITNFMKDLTDQPFHPGSDYMSFETVTGRTGGAQGTDGDLTNCWIEKQLSGSGTFILEWAYIDAAHAQVSLNSVVIEDYPATYAGNGPPAYGLVTTTGSYSDGDVIRIAAAPFAFVKSFTYNGSSGGSSSGSSSSSLPCFLEGTRILTTNGYKNIELLDPKKDKLLDKDNKPLNFLDIQKYSQENNGNQYPYKIPIGSELSAEYMCNRDLYLTYNHCVYLPHLDKFAPVSATKHLKEDKTLTQKKFTYYHIFTENYFSDTIMANGIPCESHSKFTFEKLRNIDPSCKLLKNVIKKAGMLPNCMRNRVSIKETKQIIKKFQSKQNKKKAKQMKKK